jgi:hypothetical protein
MGRGARARVRLDALRRRENPLLRRRDGGILLIESLEAGAVVTALAGLGLAAACGFRVFFPPLLLAVASHYGWVNLPENYAWLGSQQSFAVLSIAAVVEIVAFCIPWLDNLLDAIAVPMALVSGVLVSVPFLGEIDPVLKWTLAIVAGGGAAGTVQAGSMALRALSTAATGGLANPVFAVVESVGAILMTFLAIFLPLVAAGIVCALLYFAVRLVLKLKRMRTA